MSVSNLFASWTSWRDPYVQLLKITEPFVSPSFHKSFFVLSVAAVYLQKLTKLTKKG